jgi:hypothetical protein
VHWWWTIIKDRALELEVAHIPEKNDEEHKNFVQVLDNLKKKNYDNSQQANLKKIYRQTLSNQNYEKIKASLRYQLSNHLRTTVKDLRTFLVRFCRTKCEDSTYLKLHDQATQILQQARKEFHNNAIQLTTTILQLDATFTEVIQ